jgi:hypothetical protein
MVVDAAVGDKPDVFLQLGKIKVQAMENSLCEFPVGTWRPADLNFPPLFFSTGNPEQQCLWVIQFACHAMLLMSQKFLV